MRLELISSAMLAPSAGATRGEFYFEQDAPLALPDFRGVTRGGEQLLVEVKNVGGRFLPRPQRIRAATVRAQQLYAQLTGARLLYAHYWAGNNHWSLVDCPTSSSAACTARPACTSGHQTASGRSTSLSMD